MPDAFLDLFLSMAFFIMESPKIVTVYLHRVHNFTVPFLGGQI
jgi:hypothetical protein